MQPASSSHRSPPKQTEIKGEENAWDKLRQYLGEQTTSTACEEHTSAEAANTAVPPRTASTDAPQLSDAVIIIPNQLFLDEELEANESRLGYGLEGETLRQFHAVNISSSKREVGVLEIHATTEQRRAAERLSLRVHEERVKWWHKIKGHPVKAFILELLSLAIVGVGVWTLLDMSISLIILGALCGIVGIIGLIAAVSLNRTMLFVFHVAALVMMIYATIGLIQSLIVVHITTIIATCIEVVVLGFGAYCSYRLREEITPVLPTTA